MKSALRTVLEALLRRVDDAESLALEGAAKKVLEDDVRADARASALAAVVKVGRRHGVNGVARLLSIAPSVASEFIKDLERQSLVHRVLREGTQQHAIIITREGAEVLAAAETHEARVTEIVLARLDDDAQKMFLELLQKATEDAS